MTHLVGGELSEDQLPRSVRLFPLPDHVFLPDLPTPYRIFEPRYVQLVEDLLDLPEEKRWLAIPRLASGWDHEPEGEPAFEPVATVGRLLDATRTDEGHYLVVVRGLLRARLAQIPSSRLYRRASVRPWPDLGDDAEARADFPTVLQLFAALRPYIKDEELDPVAAAVRDAPDPSTAAYRLASVFLVDPDARQMLLESRRPADWMARVRDALAAVLAAASAKATDGGEPPS